MQLVVLLTYFVLFSRASIGERLHEQIYSSIEGGAACFRRLNGTHQAGCSSSDSGAVGAVHMIKEASDAQWMVYNGTAGPYMAVVNTVLFEDVIELFIEEPSNVAGVLLYDNAVARPDAFSEESRSPNEYSASLGKGIVWNDKGTGLLRRHIPFPIFYLPPSRAEEIVKIEQCYERFNLDKDNQKGQPLCSIQLNSFMFAVANTQVCMRRSSPSRLLTSTKVCDPLGDYNVYYSLFPRGKENNTQGGPSKTVILVTARIDAASLFDGVAPGAASSVVGMVTLIMAAATLAQMIPQSDAHLYDKNVLWTLFNGESFDYIGSQRVAYDLKRGAWPPLSPLTPTDVDLHVEIGQIGGSLLMYQNSSWPLYAFAPYDPSTNVVVPAAVMEFRDAIANNLNTSTVTLELTGNVPPSSLHSFQRALQNATFPELLLVDHERNFTNMYYQSALDDAINIGFLYHNITVGPGGEFLSTEWLLQNGTMTAAEPQVKVARLATAVARALYQRITGAPYAGEVTASAHMADELLHCFLESQGCRALAAADFAGNADAGAARAAPLYVGVSAWASAPAVYAGHLLAVLAGEALTVDRAACDALNETSFSYFYLKGWNHTGVCYRTTMNLSQAISPAFTISDYDMSSGEYSTWTESVWNAMWARVFVSAGGRGARAAAAAGAFATAAAAALAYWLRAHAALLFAATPPAHSALDDGAIGILRTVNC